MRELLQTDCYQVAFTGDKEKPTVRELAIHRGDKTYIISVTTPDYLERLIEYNRQFDPSVQLDENFYLVDELTSIEDLCAKLSQIPFEDLQPYFTEQLNSEDLSSNFP